MRYSNPSALSAEVRRAMPREDAELIEHTESFFPEGAMFYGLPSAYCTRGRSSTCNASTQT